MTGEPFELFANAPEEVVVGIAVEKPAEMAQGPRTAHLSPALSSHPGTDLDMRHFAQTILNYSHDKLICQVLDKPSSHASLSRTADCRLSESARYQEIINSADNILEPH